MPFDFSGESGILNPDAEEVRARERVSDLLEVTFIRAWEVCGTRAIFTCVSEFAGQVPRDVRTAQTTAGITG
jgi:hypothetical protein